MKRFRHGALGAMFLLLAAAVLPCPRTAAAQEGAPWAQETAETETGRTVTTDNALIIVGEPAGPPRTGAALDEITETVADTMRCPVCQGLSVAASPSESAQAMKQEVRELLAAGYSPDQVVRYFETSYGEFVRLAPKAVGFNLVVWIAPVAGLLLGLGLILWMGRRSSGASRAEQSDGSDDFGLVIDPELLPYLEQVRREVAA